MWSSARDYFVTEIGRLIESRFGTRNAGRPSICWISKNARIRADRVPGGDAPVGGAGAAMEVDEAFDRAWRRVGLALDRGGFTVEDRDRSAGLYYVRYVDPKSAGKDEPGFFSKLFGWDSKEPSSALQRYRLSVKTTGATTQVAVLNNQGNADSGEAARQIVARLVDELK